jgi:SsrA-binding protein
VEGSEIFLVNAYIPEYNKAHVKMQHEVRRPRKLLLHKTQMNKLIGAVQRKGTTLIPLSIYFNKRGIAKVELGIATGKKQHDKRETIKTRDWQREKSRIMRDKG